MVRLRRKLATSRSGRLRLLAPLALALLGCPQLLPDDFVSALPGDPDSAVPARSRPGVDPRPGATDAGSPGPSLPATDSGAGSPVPPPDAGRPAAEPPDGEPPPCVPGVEQCDGRDNDCDGVIDESPACPGDCAGVLLEGRGAMFCGGAGATFANAESRCSAQGMRPVVVDSAQKSEAVIAAVGPLYSRLSTISESQNSIWVDAHDGEMEGTWHWGTSGTVFWLGDAMGSAQNGAYVSWATGKPNNSGTGDGEDCAVMHVVAGTDPLGTWNDETCDGVHTFLCQAAGP